MNADPPDTQASLQFSLRALLVLTALVALAYGLLFAAPGCVAALTMVVLLMTLPVAWLTGVVYGRGYLRTFCIGALVPAGTILLGIGLLLTYWSFAVLSVGAWDAFYSEFDEIDWRFGMMVSILGGLNLLAGTLAVVVRWMIEPPRPSRSHSAVPSAALPWTEDEEPPERGFT